MRIEVIAKVQHEAVHYWPGCDLEQVAFLKHPHRHLFMIEARKRVEATDREVEVILLSRKIKDYLDMQYGMHFGSMSCEDIAVDIVQRFELSRCTVLEDGENGAEVTA